MFDITEPLKSDAISPDGKPVSLQKQLTERIQQAILSGYLPADTRLMSSRALSKELGISRNTVVNVYEHLAAEGYILADRQGTRVAPVSGLASKATAPMQSRPDTVQLATRLTPFITNPLQPESDALLSPGMPAIKEFPITVWRRAIERANRQFMPRMLGYGAPTGEYALRDAIATHLHVARGVRCDPHRIVITEGARQALELCVTLLTDPGDTVWMEEPGYRGAKAAFSAGNLHMEMMKVDGEGVCIPEDAWQNRAPKLIYLTPAHQYPTGAVLSVSRRLSLITQAARKNAWLIEDDYDGDFRHSGGPIASMQGLTEDAPVFYIGSFSKTMFPSLKLGYVVFPANVMKQASPVLNEIMRSGQQLQQLALADFMKSGEFGRHLGRMRRLYRERQRILRQALTEHFSPEQVLGGKSGMHLTLLLAPGTDDKKIVSLARQHGIGVQAFSSYSVSNDAAAGLVIGYGNTPAEVIPEAVSVLAALSRQERRF